MGQVSMIAIFGYIFVLEDGQIMEILRKFFKKKLMDYHDEPQK
jgi:hypothetical protein